jgi:hypothetical protein
MWLIVAKNSLFCLRDLIDVHIEEKGSSNKHQQQKKVNKWGFHITNVNISLSIRRFRRIKKQSQQRYLTPIIQVCEDKRKLFLRCSNSRINI